MASPTPSLNDALEMVVDLQTTTRPIRISIGHVVNNVVRHDTIVVHDAPPAVVKALAAELAPSLTADGLVITGVWGNK